MYVKRWEEIHNWRHKNRWYACLVCRADTLKQWLGPGIFTLRHGNDDIERPLWYLHRKTASRIFKRHIFKNLMHATFIRKSYRCVCVCVWVCVCALWAIWRPYKHDVRSMCRKGADHGGSFGGKMWWHSKSAANRHAEVVLCLHHGLDFKNILRSRHEHNQRSERRTRWIIWQRAPLLNAVYIQQCGGKIFPFVCNHRHTPKRHTSARTKTHFSTQSHIRCAN